MIEMEYCSQCRELEHMQDMDADNRCRKCAKVNAALNTAAGAAHDERSVDLAELRRLHEAATPGPWEVYSHQSGNAEGCYVSVEADARGVLFDTLNAGSVRTIYSPEDNESGWFEEGESADNLRLAVAARNALPSLLDRLEAAEADRERLDWLAQSSITPLQASGIVNGFVWGGKYRGSLRGAIDAAREAVEGEVKRS